MAKQENDTLYVIGAAYDDVDAAVSDYEAIKELYHEVKSSHDFDAAVIEKDEKGKVRIVKKHEQPTRHGAAVGLGWGLATGVTALLFPPVGIGIAAAGGAGAAIGGVVGHASGGMSRGDLKDLGETLDTGQAGLIAVYEFQPRRSGRRDDQGGQPRHLQGDRHGRRSVGSGHEAGRGGGRAGTGDHDRNRRLTLQGSAGRSVDLTELASGRAVRSGAGDVADRTTRCG